MNNTTRKNMILEEIGITPEMQTVFETLLDVGFCTAGKMSSKTGFKRSYVYKLLDLLEAKSLVRRDKQKNKVTYYYPQSPQILNELIEKQKDKFKEEENLLKNNLSRMLSKFNILEGKPNISFFEGVNGIKQLYEDILLEKKDIKLIRSIKDASNEELENILYKQKLKQTSLGIKIKVVGPIGIRGKEFNIEKLKKRDEEKLVERRVLEKEDFSNEAQIIIYSNKVAITSYDEHLVTTLIESSTIKNTFENIFSILWDKGEKPY